MLRRSIFGTAKDTNKRGQKQACLHFAGREYLRRSQRYEKSGAKASVSPIIPDRAHIPEAPPSCHGPGIVGRPARRAALIGLAPGSACPDAGNRPSGIKPSSPETEALPESSSEDTSRKRNRSFRGCDHRPRNRPPPETESPPESSSEDTPPETESPFPRMRSSSPEPPPDGNEIAPAGFPARAIFKDSSSRAFSRPGRVRTNSPLPRLIEKVLFGPFLPGTGLSGNERS